jgi:hypothetical protein
MSSARKDSEARRVDGARRLLSLIADALGLDIDVEAMGLVFR